jgi:hypothetical protein
LYLFFTPSTCTNLSYSAKAWNLSENDWRQPRSH